MPRLSRFAISALVVGASVSLVLAPQAQYVATQRRFVPWAGAAALSLLFGVVLGLVELRLLRALAERCNHSLQGSFGLLVALAHTPLYILWWPAATGSSSSTARVWVPVSLTIAAAFVAALFWIREQRPRQRLALKLGGVFAATLAGTSVLVQARSESTFSFLVAFLWGVYLLLSFTGWGTLVNWALTPSERVDWGQRAAWGMAVVIAAGGVLNLTWSVSPTTVLALLALGAAFLGLESGDDPSPSLRQWLRSHSYPARTLLLVGVAAVGLLQLGASVAGSVDTVVAQPAFDLHDDHQAYLAFPHKMLELGSMGAEPFEARRMLNLGGQSFLHATVLAALPLRTLHLVDSGVALLVVLGLVTGYCRRRGLDPGHEILVLLVVLALPHLEMRGNTSALLTGVVFLLSWFRLLGDGTLSERAPLRSAGLVAVVASGLCAVKSTFVPAAVAMFAGSYLVLFVRSRGRQWVAREATLAAGLVGVLVLPWMISIFESSHTLLYPVLGKGFYGGLYTGDFASISGDFGLAFDDYARGFLRHLVQLLPVVVLLAFLRDDRPRAPALVLAGAALASVALLVIIGDPTLSRSLTRYVFPVASAATVGLLLAVLEHRGESSGRTSMVPMVAGMVVAVVMLVRGGGAIMRTYDQVLDNLANAMAGEDVVDGTDRLAMAELATSLPPSAPVLTSLPHPFLLDVRRNPVLLMSLPGMSSLPPGLPVYEGSEAVADYLQRIGIRHLAYGGMDDLRDLFTLTEDRIRDKYPRSKMRWTMLRYQRRYRAAVIELAGTRKRLYSNDTTVLLDLGQRVLTVVPGERVGSTEGFFDGVWTDGEGVIHDVGCDPCGTYILVKTMGWHPFGDDRDRVGLEVFADGQALHFERHAADGFVFRVDPPRASIDTLVIRSTTIDPATVGSHPDGRRLGIDVRAVEISNDPAVGDVATRRFLQPILGLLTPEQVRHRSGFHDDFNWTAGDAWLREIRWPVAQGQHFLVVSMHPVHPFAHDPDRLAIRVAVNGVELERVRMVERDLFFRLYANVSEINELRLVSSTFIPHELNGSPDQRTLGIPVESMRLE